MTSIIFENWPTTNWLDKDWVKTKHQENQIKELMLIEDWFPRAGGKRKAQIMGISTGYYYQLMAKYKIKEKIT